VVLFFVIGTSKFFLIFLKEYTVLWFYPYDVAGEKLDGVYSWQAQREATSN